MDHCVDLNQYVDLDQSLDLDQCAYLHQSLDLDQSLDLFQCFELDRNVTKTEKPASFHILPPNVFQSLVKERIHLGFDKFVGDPKLWKEPKF